MKYLKESNRVIISLIAVIVILGFMVGCQEVKGWNEYPEPYKSGGWIVKCELVDEIKETCVTLDPSLEQ